MKLNEQVILHYNKECFKITDLIKIENVQITLTNYMIEVAYADNQRFIRASNFDIQKSILCFLLLTTNLPIIAENDQRLSSLIDILFHYMRNLG